MSGWWFSTSTPVSSTNKTDRHDLAEILLKVALNTIKPNQTRNHENGIHEFKLIHLIKGISLPSFVIFLLLYE
jgi:hypothetical protein